MALPSHNSFLSPVIVITQSPEFVLPSLNPCFGSAGTAKAPRAQRGGETPVKHIEEYLKVSAASPLQHFQHGITSFLARRRLCAHEWRSWDGVLYQADRRGACCQLPSRCKDTDGGVDCTVERRGEKYKRGFSKNNPTCTTFLLRTGCSLPTWTGSAVPEHTGDCEGF